MKRKITLIMLALVLVITPLLSLAEEVEAANVQSTIPTSIGMKALVEQFLAEEEITDGNAARALTTHLAAISHYEQQEQSDKVVKHMESFKILIGHQLGNEMISELAYQTLMEASEHVIREWNSIALVRNGEAQAVILIEDFTKETIVNAANILADYVKKSTGVQLPIMTESDWITETQYEDFVPIFVGIAPSAEQAFLLSKLEGMDEQGFLIHSDQSVTIISSTVWGTFYGVHEFLERYVGVRWLMTGPTGEDVPQLSDLFVLRETVKEEPAFKYRAISAGIWDTGWLEANKIQTGVVNWPINFMHNLHTVFPPEKYGESHPHLYPGGSPPTTPGDITSWQPCFTAEDAVDIAVTEILAFFAERPERNSFALGVNDSTNYCEADPSHPEYTGELNSIGSPDMSDFYFAWVNDVVEQVLEVYPDKWFGVLAYQYVMDPPSFPIHSRVVPYLTKDRMMWIDEEIKAEGHAQMEAWNEVASQVAWYDYMYGTQYVLPRVYPHVMAENYKYAIDNGVFGNYTEMYHNVGDGPKAWVSAKLQWDPYQDVDALLQEWYERAVGPEAAEYLAAYYDLWEQFWTERIVESPWFYSGNNTYLPFTRAEYVELITMEDVTESKRLLDSVVALAQTEPQKKRAELIYRMFEYYEATILSYPLAFAPPEDEAVALEMLDHLLNSSERVEYAQKRHELIDELAEDPASEFRGTVRVNWSGWNSDQFWHLADYMATEEAEGGAVTEQVYEQANGNIPSSQRTIARLLEQVDKGLEASLTRNPSFEAGDDDADSWSKWITGSGTIERVEGVAYTGEASLLVNHLRRGGPNQNNIRIDPGLSALRARYYAPEGAEKGTISLTFHVKNAQGENMMSFYSTPADLADHAGEWSTVGMLVDIPEEVDGQKIASSQYIVTISNGAESQVYIDDVVLYQEEDSSLGWSAEDFWQLADEMAGEPEGGPITDQIIEMANSDEPSNDRDIARVLLEANKGKDFSLIVNPSFEEGVDYADSWGKWTSGSGTLERVEGIAHTGNASLLVNYLNRGGPHQNNIRTVVPGLAAMRVHYYTPSGTDEGTLTLVIHARNRQGANIASFYSDAIDLTATSGKWSSAGLLVELPESVNGEEMVSAQVVLTIDKAGNSQVYLDDAVLYQFRKD